MRTLFVVVALFVVFATVYLTRTQPEATQPVVNNESMSSTSPAAATKLDELAAPKREAVAAIETALVAATATLAVDVVDSLGAAVSEADVFVTTETSQSRHARTDVAGRSTFEVPSSAPLVVHAGLRGETTNTTVEVESLLPGEVRTLVVEVTERAATLANVLVRVRTEDGAPVMGAKLYLERVEGFSSRGDPWSLPPRALPSAETDSNGKARVDTEAVAATVAIVSAPGLSTQVVTLREASPDSAPREEVLVTLRRAARVEGVALGAPTGARARAVGPGYGLQSPDLRGKVFLTQDVRFEAALAPDGSFALEDLPVGAPLRFELVAGHEVLVAESERITLTEGEVRRFEWRIGEGATLRCIVREEVGRAAPDVGVWLLPAGKASPGLAGSYWEPRERGKTDAQGIVTFGPVRPGPWIVALEPAQGRRVADDAYAPIAIAVMVAQDDKAPTAELTPFRGKFVHGVVRDPDGEGVRTHILLFGPNGIFENVNSAADGTFRSDALPPGEYRIQAKSPSSGRGKTFAPSAEVTVEPSAEPIELRLQRGATLQVTASDGATRRSATFTATRLPQIVAQGFSTVSPQQSKSFEGLELGEYVVTAQTEDGLIGVATGVVLTAPDVREVDVPLRRAGTVRIRYEGPHRYLQCRVSIAGVNVFAGTVLAGGEEVFQLPPGHATVTVAVYDPESTTIPRARLFEEEHFVDVMSGFESVLHVKP